MQRKHWVAGAVVSILFIMVAEVGLSTRQESASWDEGDHIYAGYMNWKHREYSLNPEHPPLVKLIATLSLLPLDLKIAPRQGRYFKSESYYGGRELLFRNDPKYGGHYSADTLLFRIHMTVLVFALVLALLLFAAGREMFGSWAGLIAMMLFVFDPTVLTNAPFVTTDMGAACGFFAAVYTFYRFVKSMRWQRAALCGLATGLALTAKHSTVLLLPILILLAAGEIAGRWKAGRKWPGRDVLSLVSGMAAIAAIALFVLWGVYSFRYAMHPTGVEMPPLSGQLNSLSPVMQHLISFCARHHLLPESYLYGLVDVQRVGIYMPTYIFGKLYAHGQWFYFPVLLSLKWSVGVLGLLALAIYAFVAGKVRRPREVFFLALPALFYLAAAMAGPLNIGIRHVLPVFPFVFALAGAGAAWMAQQRKAWACVVGALLLWHVIDSVRMFPNYMPYANTLWGGPTKTHLYFSDSATEWGQELKWTKQWLDAHNVKDCWFAYFPAPFLLPSDYGVPCKLLPTLDTMYEYDIALPPVVHGPVLISLADLNGFEFGTKVRNPYQALFECKPDDVIANGVAVFYGDFALPDAAALGYEQQTHSQMKDNPQAALAAAQQAVALVPEGFDANIALGDVFTATGDKASAHAAYAVAMRRVPEMEPTSQKHWKPILEKKMVGSE
ncbi:glycosyltransferase family 39 protein [Acidobacterium sp. S8]|uniref:ArnT family glycosyltransferase n=1 Tax=Acidobacterium sp. S8 TaxID=1641854 RepID=UPI00131E4A1B|nr:glycosyltransferase family 39 protein [Acidobacterium sp. S8]